MHLSIRSHCLNGTFYDKLLLKTFTFCDVKNFFLEFLDYEMCLMKKYVFDIHAICMLKNALYVYHYIDIFRFIICICFTKCVLINANYIECLRRAASTSCPYLLVK